MPDSLHSIYKGFRLRPFFPKYGTIEKANLSLSMEDFISFKINSIEEIFSVRSFVSFKFLSALVFSSSNFFASMCTFDFSFVNSISFLSRSSEEVSDLDFS